VNLLIFVFWDVVTYAVGKDIAQFSIAVRTKHFNLAFPLMFPVSSRSRIKNVSVILIFKYFHKLALAVRTFRRSFFIAESPCLHLRNFQLILSNSLISRLGFSFGIWSWDMCVNSMLVVYIKNIFAEFYHFLITYLEGFFIHLNEISFSSFCL
jgi:hypothetical protein